MTQISDQEFETIKGIDLSGTSSVPASALEKDLHITKVLKILATLDLGNWRMIFCGGTSLSKAHEVISRMSEDVDLKLASIEELSLSQRRRQLSVIKADVQSKLTENGYKVGSEWAGSNNTHFSFNLAYQGRFDLSSALRPEMKIELVQTDNPFGTEYRRIENLFGRFAIDDSEHFEFESVSVEQTLGEKIVSFLRRSKSAAEWDPRLVRHLYDVHQIGIYLSLGDEVFQHFHNAVEYDRFRYRERDPDFYLRPIEVMAESAKNLKRKGYENDYQNFAKDLIFGTSPTYKEVLQSFSEIAEDLLSKKN